MKAKIALTVVVPVYNEEEDLPRHIPRLYNFFSANLQDYLWEILIADNASTDKTPVIGKKLAQKNGISYLRIREQGRGGALKTAWSRSKSDLLAYMDVDLSSELAFFPKLLQALSAGADLAIGSRLSPGARVYGRTVARELMSRAYNLLIKILFWTSFHDAQCGFKAIKKGAAESLLPHVRDTAWFFDSELLIMAAKAGFKIVEVPIVWRDDPRSTVKVAKTAWGDIQGLVRLFVTRPWRNLND